MGVKNKDGNENRFNELWVEYEPYIRKLCMYKLNSMPHHIDDCVQEVFKALFTSMTKGVVIEHPKTWLSTVANNKIRDIYSQSKRESEIFVQLTEKICNTVPYVNPIQNDELSEEKIEAHLTEVIGVLNPYERKLFEDHYIKRIKEKTMAYERGVTENLIQQQVFRLKRKIINKVNQLVE